MEELMVEGNVLMAFIHQPMTLPDGQRFYALEVCDDLGTIHRFVADAQPEIFGRDGLPTVLAGEIGPGSKIRIKAHGKAVRAIQIIDFKTTNPFAPDIGPALPLFEVVLSVGAMMRVPEGREFFLTMAHVLDAVKHRNAILVATNRF
jgi:hypothetical protein